MSYLPCKRRSKEERVQTTLHPAPTPLGETPFSYPRRRAADQHSGVVFFGGEFPVTTLGVVWSTTP